MLLVERSTEVLLRYSLRHSEESLDGVVNNLGLSFLERYTIAPDFAVVMDFHICKFECYLFVWLKDR